MCKCNCKNGSDIQDFLIPSETAGVYVLGLTHYTCGNRKLLLSDVYDVTAQLNAVPVGNPIDVGNGAFCQECQVTGTVSYRACGCCDAKTEFVNYQCCLPCSSAVQPKVGIETVVANPKAITYYMNNGCGCCAGTKPCTNQIAITTSIQVTTA